MKIGFVGAGKMASAIAGGLVENGVWSATDLLAADVSAAARARFVAATGVRCLETAGAVVPDVDVVLLAVKPQVAQAAIAPIADQAGGKLVVSIAAGITLARLCSWFGTDRVVRVMPNTPLTVGQGASAFACAAGVRDGDRDIVSAIFGALGVVHELAEEQLDAVTALSGSGPAYVFEMIQALVEAGVAEGLPADVALELTAQTVAGAATMVQRKLGTPDDLRIAVTSPGGTTAAGLAVLAEAGFRGLVAEVVQAAARRSAELGRG